MTKKRFRNLCLSYTSKCLSECRHCSVNAGPNKNIKLAPNIITPLLPYFHKIGIRQILFTGGEPLLYYKEVAEIINETKKLGWHSCVFTNAYWAKNTVISESILTKLKNSGINQFFISTSRYHMEYISLDKIINAFSLINKIGTSCTILHMSDFASNSVSNDNELISSKIRELRIPEKVYNLLPVGRAKLLPETRLAYIISHKKLSKMTCGLTDQIHIDPYGNIQRCCNIYGLLDSMEAVDFFQYGNINNESVHDILKKTYKYNLLFKILHTKGPFGIYLENKKLLEDSGFYLNNLYSSKCELCSQLLGNKKYYSIIARNLS